jgi:hypothetical protein
MQGRAWVMNDQNVTARGKSVRANMKVYDLIHAHAHDSIPQHNCLKSLEASHHLRQ